MTKGYACPLWLTFKQLIELGGHVRKGEAAELVVYADRITPRARKSSRKSPT
jgi:antirestriction protein ArdC